jgi:hypothetical protein
MKVALPALLLLVACGSAPPPPKPNVLSHRRPADPPPVSATADAAPDTDAPPTGLVAAALLDEQQLQAITSYTGTFETGPLEGEESTAYYSSHHFRAHGKSEAFDAALRLWTFSTATEAVQHFDSLAASLPSVTHANELATRSFRAREGAILGVAFVDEPRQLVVLFTCGDQQCTTEETAVALTRAIQERLRSLAPTP